MFCVQGTGREKYICGLNYGTFMHMVKNIMELELDKHLWSATYSLSVFGKLFKLSESQFAHLVNGDNSPHLGLLVKIK